MKINEVEQPADSALSMPSNPNSLVGTARQMANPFARGIAKAIAPTAVADYDAYKQKHGRENPAQAMDLPQLSTPQEREIEQIFQDLVAAAGARKTISVDAIKKALAGSNLNEAINPKEIDQLTQYLVAKLAQAGIKVTTPTASTAKSQVAWDPNKSLLTYKGQQYQKTKKGWKNWYTKEMVDDFGMTNTLDAAFDKAIGRTPAPAAQPKLPTVTTNAGIKVVKDLQGTWWRLDDRTRVSDPAQVQALEKLLRNQTLVARARGQAAE